MCGLDEGATDKRRRDADEPSRSGDIVPAGKDGSEDGMLIYSVEVARRAEVGQTTRKLGATIPPGGGWSGWPNKLLGSVRPGDAGKNTLVLDLDETLVHSSFQPPIGQADYVIPIDIEGRVVKVHVTKRPHLDEFLEYIAGKFEVVVFTASLAKYADPLLDLLDKNKCISWRLFRDACHNVQGNYVKNLECLGRDAGSVIIVDNSPHSYVFQPENALPIPTFIDDPLDTGVLSLIPYLERLRYSRDVRKTLAEMGVDPFPED
jgi:RNA polymerase II subunit A small phosphatase-like protein